MKGGHRRPPRVSRRTVLGLGAAAAASVTAVGLQQLRSGASEGESGAQWAQPTTETGASVAPAPAKPVSTKPMDGGPVPGKPGKAMLGSYLSLKDKSYKESLALRKQQLGRDEKIAHVFYAWGDTLPSRILNMPKKAVPLVSWRGTNYDDILDGSSDDIIRRAAWRLKQFDKPVFLRWGWEMNGNWFPWSGPKNKDDPEGYIATWKYLRKVFKKEGADNVAWVWSINWNSSPAAGWNRFQAYYPGDDHVDWVGISGYNLNNETPETLYEALYQEYAGRKPMMITEVGSVDNGGTTKGDWITQFAQYVEQRPNICGVVWFDTDTHESYHEVWKIDTDPHALAAYKAMAKSARFWG
ncbi:MAG: glycosyl hydrolase [Actinoplanes sp.]